MKVKDVLILKEASDDPNEGKEFLIFKNQESATIFGIV
jgi:hypothetical protein